MKTVFTLLFLLTLQAFAQITVVSKPVKSQFVSHEQVYIDIAITNRTGRSITLKGSGLDNWLNVNIYDQQQRLLPYVASAPAFKSVVIPIGETMKKRLNISQYYDLTRYGRYSYSISVRIPGPTNQVAISPSKRFMVTNARVIASQKIGIPGTTSARTYEVMRHNGDKHSSIYVKLTNDFTNKVMACSVLSPIVNSEPPKFALDASNDLHLLYLVTQTTFAHHVISPTGQIKKREYHKAGAYEKPRFITFSKGEVKVAGTVPYDPKKARKEADKERKASDRPEFQ